ncbi:hypothetical protein D3C84_862890 [compost metagenome]
MAVVLRCGFLFRCVSSRAVWLILDSAFRLRHQYRRTAIKRAGNLEDDRQRGHVLTALNLAHVRALNSSEVRQRLLGDAALRTQRAHCRAESLRQLGIEGGRAGWSAGLYGSLLHGQKRLVEGESKPRYI